MRGVRALGVNGDCRAAGEARGSPVDGTNAFDGWLLDRPLGKAGVRMASGGCGGACGVVVSMTAQWIVTCTTNAGVETCPAENQR